MTLPLTAVCRQMLMARHRELRRWLLEDAYPLWMTQGYDSVRGGFEERLDLDGSPRDEPRRARVQPRQIYCFAMAPRLGFKADVEPMIEASVEYLVRHYRRGDGLFRTCIHRSGEPNDDRPALYDQAFVLLACAAVAESFPTLRVRCAKIASDLGTAVEQHLRTAGRGFQNGLPFSLPLQSNPHMHLFEACLAWVDAGEDGPWLALADEIGQLALDHFIDPRSGALREFFTADWSPAASQEGQIVEPGHQFEWAWLLMRWDPDNLRGGRDAAAGLIDLAEEHGVRHGVAINALLDDLSVRDESARLWPQTERLKAAALAARLTPDARHFEHAAAAAAGLLSYFDTPTAGLWRDRRQPTGEFVVEPAPASSFYHIVAGAAEFDRLMANLPDEV